MKQFSKTFLFLLVLIASFSGFAVPPQSIHYQAYLKNNAGLPVNSSQSITFRLYDAVIAGTQLWNEIQTVAVNNGLLGVQLGSTVNPLPKTALNNPVWLGIQIGSDTEASPRTALNSTTNAFRAEEADLLNGLQANEIISAASDEVRTPISSLPYSITAPGSYYLTGNLTATTGGIDVLVSNVTLDLMGFTLFGAGVSDDGINLNYRNNVTIRNGTVRDWGYNGIYQFNSSNSDNDVVDVKVLNNGYSGIYLKGSNSHIERCVAGDNVGLGLYAGGIGARLIGNTAYNNQGTYGIYGYSGSTIINNTAYNNQGTYGIYGSSGSTIINNTAYNNQVVYGIYGSSRSIITGNLASGNSNTGIFAGTGSSVSENNASNNGETGINTDTGSTVIGNTISNNGKWGLYASSAGVIKDNSIYNNNTSATAGVGGMRTAKANRIIGNTLTVNKVNNFYFAGTSNVIEDNFASGSTSVTTNGYNFVAGSNFYKDNRATGNTVNYTGNLPTGSGNGGGNVSF